MQRPYKDDARVIARPHKPSDPFYYRPKKKTWKWKSERIKVLYVSAEIIMCFIQHYQYSRLVDDYNNNILFSFIFYIAGAV